MDSPTRNASAFGASPQGAPSVDRQSRIHRGPGFSFSSCSDCSPVADGALK
jgi:hypothetical protein